MREEASQKTIGKAENGENLNYSDKYDLLDKCIEEHLNRLITFCNDNESQPATTMVSDLQPVFDYFAANYLFFSSMLANQRSSVFRERLRQFISASVKEKLDRQHQQPDIDNELNAEFMSSAFIGILEWWVRNQMPHSSAYMAEQVRKLYEKNEVFPAFT